MRLIDADALPFRGITRKVMTVKDGRLYNELTAEVVVFLQDIEKAQTVDAEPVVHGYWIVDGLRRWSRSDGKHGSVVVCSQCKTDGSPQWKRCPVCEAKMDGNAPVEVEI